jgi:glutamyl-tRNA synthetase
LKDVRERALRWALANAVEHKGSASSKAVTGKLIAELPELRSKVGEATAIVEDVVAEVNRLSPAEQHARLLELGPPETIQHEKKLGLPDLPDVGKYQSVVTRFAPNPNGPLHIGHIRAALLSNEYARIYKGKFILRFEDTNPANAMLEMYDLIRHDLNWLKIGWDEEYIQSDRLEIYYRYAEQLLSAGKAYVCTCEVEDFRGLRDRGEPCPCRDLSASEQMERWHAMMYGQYGEERAVVRIKTDLRDPNPAVRDWPALRVVSAAHPRVGNRYKVWPLYNFSVSIDDHDMGVTHVIRGKEHVVNETRQRTLFEHLVWDYPTAVQYGRLTIGGAVLSKTQTMQGIRNGEFSSYDDPRLGTIAALRRRGFLPEAIRQVIMDVGPTPVDAALSWETLAAYNRKFADAIANRYFFVPNPVKFNVRGVPEQLDAHLRLHPSDPNRGKREIPLMHEGGCLTVYLPKDDLSSMHEGQMFRLKDLVNVELRSLGPDAEADFRGLELIDVPKIQWVSAEAIEVEVIKPDNSRDKGLAEPAVAGLKVGAIAQFERYGFVRIDSTKPKFVAVYGHR